MTEVRFFFDFLSPYSCLALLRAEEFQKRHDVRFALKPVTLSSLLEHHEIKGAGVVPAKRAYVAADIQRVAQAQGLEFPGPPKHPFFSVDSLRVALLFREHELGLALCSQLARRCWCEGADLTDREVLEEAVRAVGLDAGELDERLMDRDIKKTLRANSAEAIELGVFGVPTFVLGESELFWGQDRMDALAARLANEVDSPLAKASELLSRG